MELKRKFYESLKEWKRSHRQECLLVKEDQRLSGDESLAADEGRYLRHKVFRLQTSVEDFARRRVKNEIEFNETLVLFLPEFFNDEGLSNLPSTLDKKALLMPCVFPLHQPIVEFSPEFYH